MTHHNLKQMLREVIWAANNPGMEKAYLVPNFTGEPCLLDNIVDEFVDEIKQEVLDLVYDNYVRKDKY